MLEKLWHVLLLGEPVVMPPPAAYNAAELWRPRASRAY